MRVLVLLAICSAALAADLEKPLGQANVRCARRIASLALQADKAGQRASARRLYERAVVLDPENRIARGKLGFKKKSGAWSRSSDAAIEVFGRKDADPTKVLKLREQRKELEEQRAKDILKVTARYGTPESARPHLIAALQFAPRFAPLHEALGHEKIGDVYVRHELTDFVRAMPARRNRWAGCAQPADVVAVGEPVVIDGVEGARTLYRVGTRFVATGLKPEATTYIVSRTECAHALLRELFGADVPRWDPPRVYFLLREQYEAYLKARIKDADALKRALDYPSYASMTGIVERVGSNPDLALDGYAHGVLFRSAAMIVSPRTGFFSADTDRYPWFKEAVAVFGTLELHDAANSWFVSEKESTGKSQPSLPLPDPLTKATSIGYIREQFYDGALPPMREVFGNSLNNLDRIKAIYASTFVRFLALYDPEGLRAFAIALRSSKGASQTEQAMHALEKAFGKSGDELLRLWQAYLLELS